MSNQTGENGRDGHKQTNPTEGHRHNHLHQNTKKPSEPILNKSDVSSSSSHLPISSSSTPPIPTDSSQSGGLAPPPTGSHHQKQPSVHAHFKIDDVVGHSRSFNRSRSGSGSDGVDPVSGEKIVPAEPSSSVLPPDILGQPASAKRADEAVSGGTSANNNTLSGDPRLPENDGKLHILLGATGAVSTAKLKMIINKLEGIYGRDKVSIQIIITEAAAGFVKIQDIPENIIVWRDEDEWKTWKGRADPVVHIELRRWADILVVAPLTANTLGKISLGLCDNLLTNVIRAWNTAYPILIAPAMLSYAYNHPATKRHLKVIKEEMKWIEILKPVEKVVGTFGDIGMGGMMDWNEIIDRIVMKLGGYPEEEDDEDDDVEQKNLEEEDEEDEDGVDEDDSNVEGVGELGLGDGKAHLRHGST